MYFITWYTWRNLLSWWNCGYLDNNEINYVERHITTVIFFIMMTKYKFERLLFFILQSIIVIYDCFLNYRCLMPVLENVWKHHYLVLYYYVFGLFHYLYWFDSIFCYNTISSKYLPILDLRAERGSDSGETASSRGGSPFLNHRMLSSLHLEFTENKENLNQRIL